MRHQAKGRNGVRESTVEARRVEQSEGHLVSSNKTIRLSKKKKSETGSGPKELEMKIYASLVNISKGDSKLERSDKSSLEEEVFLNDF